MSPLPHHSAKDAPRSPTVATSLVSARPQTVPPAKSQKPYSPRGAAVDLMLAKDREVLIAGPAGTGKSRGALEKLHLVASKYPGSRGLMLRKTLRSIRQSAMVTFETKVLPDRSPVFFHGGDYEYRYPNGSVIVVGGLDKSSKVMSTEYDIAYIMEATELYEADWEDVTTRLRNGMVPYQQLIADCNPSAPTHWLYRRCLNGKTKLLRSYHEDNPRLWDASAGEWTAEGRAYMEVLDALTGARRDRLRDGKWVQAEGTVYEEFDRKVHVIDRFPIPYGWRRWRVIDFGYTHSFVCQWWAEDLDGRLYLYRELVGTKKLVEDWARTIRQYSNNETITGTITDHDAEDRATLEAYLGIHTIPARKPIAKGISLVKRRLRVEGDGKPRLYVFADALLWREADLDYRKKPIGVLEEIDTYVWQRSGDGSIVKEVPVDQDNHSMDALRYMVATMDWGEEGTSYQEDLDELEAAWD